MLDDCGVLHLPLHATAWHKRSTSSCDVWIAAVCKQQNPKHQFSPNMSYCMQMSCLWSSCFMWEQCDKREMKSKGVQFMYGNFCAGMRSVTGPICCTTAFFPTFTSNYFLSAHETLDVPYVLCVPNFLLCLSLIKGVLHIDNLMLFTFALSHSVSSYYFNQTCKP